MKGYASNNSARLRSEQKMRVQCDVSDALNPLKSRLLDQLSKLERANCTQAAKSLGGIIAKLEAWQGVHGCH